MHHPRDEPHARLTRGMAVDRPDHSTDRSFCALFGIAVPDSRDVTKTANPAGEHARCDRAPTTCDAFAVQLAFTIDSAAGEVSRTVAIRQLVIAGWAGRDAAAIEHHVAELEAIGVPRPSAVPLFYRVAANQLVQDDPVQVVGSASAGEVEPFVFADDGALYVSVASDHTDRVLERTSVALSKQVCAKPIATRAWPLAEVEEHWDALMLRATIVEHGHETLYQEAAVSTLRTPADLIDRFTAGGGLPDGTGMCCGTIGVIGAIRHAPSFTMELVDPVLHRVIRHGYTLDVLDEVA